MKRPRKVAIVGAGPSGLVTAKTLLQNYPPGTFSPVVFEKKGRIGGLWAVDYPSEAQPRHGPPNEGESSRGGPRGRAYIDPWMRTNLSRFSVAFSDLSWETALGVDPGDAGGLPTFPCAWEARKYLEKYAELYIPGDCLRLGVRVLSVSRNRDLNTPFARGRWEVAWMDDRGDKSSMHGLKEPRVQRDNFDFLVVASGHFGTPHIPRIPGLEHCSNAIHSSDLQSPDDIDCLLAKSSKQGKLVVIGGSLSGVEAATSLALHLSSQNHKPGSPASAQNAYEIVHVASGPFWLLPKHLPQLRGDNTDSPRKISFVPLDLPLYDLGRRPPGPVELAFGPVSPGQVTQRHKFFRDTLGKDYSQTGCVAIDDQIRASDRPPWMGISDSYAEFVRSGAIKTITGRAVSTANSGSGLIKIHIDTPSGQTSLTDVAGIIMATGFKPSDSLSFLPQDTLSKLEYSQDDHFIPLILDRYSSSHSDIPDLGFVGFYRGAFWGPAELQAQMHAETWATVDLESASPKPLAISANERLKRATERKRVRDLRNVQPTHRRGQFILGDYVGLMESLARTLGRKRSPMESSCGTIESQADPVVPARYAAISKHGDSKRDLTQNEVDITIEAVRGRPGQLLAGATTAIFRALHGSWVFERSDKLPTHGFEKTKYFGKATFHPRYPSCPDHEAEYLFEESVDGLPAAKRLIYRLLDISRFPGQSGISISSVDDANAAIGRGWQLDVLPRGDLLDSGEILMKASSANMSSRERHEYEFEFDRVAITKWYHIIYSDNGRGSAIQVRTRYSRPANTMSTSTHNRRPISHL